MDVACKTLNIFILTDPKIDPVDWTSKMIVTFGFSCGGNPSNLVDLFNQWAYLLNEDVKYLLNEDVKKMIKTETLIIMCCFWLTILFVFLSVSFSQAIMQQTNKQITETHKALRRISNVLRQPTITKVCVILPCE